jgi:hypothetical protein
VGPLGKLALNLIGGLKTDIWGYLALSHQASEEDEYDGYCIPKGTIVIGNAWYVNSALNLSCQTHKHVTQVNFA